MDDNTMKTREAFVYVTNRIKAGAVSLSLGVLFTPIIILISDRSITFWAYFMFLIFTSNLIAKYSALRRFSQTRINLKYYSEIGSFWLQKRFEMVMPKNSWKWFKYSLKQFFALGEWKMTILVSFVYLFLAITPLLMKVVLLKSGYEIIFVILLLYVVMSFHLFFLFLNWKYKIAKKIKEEFGLDYKTLVSIN